MKMKKHLSKSIVIVLVALASAPFQAKADSVQSAGPLDYNFSGTATLTKTDDPCIVLNHETGSGNSATYGQMVWSDSEVVNFCTVPGGVDVVSQFTLTDANGSKVSGHFSTHGLFDASGNLAIEGRYEILSGTGRFEKARSVGSITAKAKSPDPQGRSPFTASMDGAMSFSAIEAEFQVSYGNTRILVQLKNDNSFSIENSQGGASCKGSYTAFNLPARPPFVVFTSNNALGSESKSACDLEKLTIIAMGLSPLDTPVGKKRGVTVVPEWAASSPRPMDGYMIRIK